MKRLARLTAAVLMAASIGAAAPGAVAQADSSSELPGCWSHPWGVGQHFWWSTGQGGDNAAGQYSYSPLGQVPSSPNGCEDINVTCGWSQCGEYRVRFYPSGGGNYANGWSSPPCGQSWCYVAAATNVLNGTWFRIEWRFNSSQYGDHDFEIYI